MVEILILCIVKEKTGILNYRRFGTGATKIVHIAQRQTKCIQARTYKMEAQQE